jgi:hypothetical protein
MTVSVTVDFCGEIHHVTDKQPLTIGREGDVVVDDNPYLHRRFLTIEHVRGLWWLANVGGQLTATVCDDNGLLQAWLAPGARIPLVFQRTTVWFTAGPTTYDFSVFMEDPPFMPVSSDVVDVGATTVGRLSFTPDQKMLIVVLAEPMLRRGDRGSGQIPSNADAASRLGWTLTKFNRKLDNVCEKLAKQGVRGLHGDAGRLAASRRSRLVEYALAARLVAVDDLIFLDSETAQSGPGLE